MAVQEQLEILDDTAPRLDEYGTPDDWFSALTAWHSEIGVKVQGLREKPKPSCPNNNLWNHHVGRAAYLLGCLALEHHVVIDIDDHESLVDFGSAVKTLAIALEMTRPDDPDEMPRMPLHW